ncbi:MAG: hypothetical protein K6G85_06310 [Eubacterium sp.]|nr:hypothetical protein [Eubacterium sp.]
MYNNKRLALSIFWIVLGVVLLGLSVAEVIESTYYGGMGGGFIAVGILQVMRNLKYRRDPEYREKIDVEVSDERNKYLRMQSWSWAGYIMVIGLAISSVIAMILGQEQVQLTLMYSMCALLMVYTISYYILSRKY